MCYLVLVDENIITALNNTKLWKRGPDMGFFNRIKRFFFSAALFPLYMSPSFRYWQADVADTCSRPEMMKNL